MLLRNQLSSCLVWRLAVMVRVEDVDGVSVKLTFNVTGHTKATSTIMF